MGYSSNKNPICPVCGQTDQVDKASTLYLYGLQSQRPATRSGDAAEELIARESLNLNNLEVDDLIRLGKRLAPPASPKEMPTRPLHPDLVIGVFSLVLPFFLVGVASSQPGLLLPMVALLLASYAFYFFKRQEAITKFESRQSDRRASLERVRRGVQRWMDLYYCARDDVVFESGSRETAPADLIAGYLLRETGSQIP